MPLCMQSWERGETSMKLQRQPDKAARPPVSAEPVHQSGTSLLDTMSRMDAQLNLISPNDIVFDQFKLLNCVNGSARKHGSAIPHYCYLMPANWVLHNPAPPARVQHGYSMGTRRQIPRKGCEPI